jgi:ferrous iron transport protein A
VERAPPISVCLGDLSVGEHAEVVGYRSASSYVNQLMSLGLIPGTTFEVRRFAPLGDPVEIRFRGFSLTLRPDEASDLILQRT